MAFKDLHVDMVVALDMLGSDNRSQATRVMPYWM
jgi:hypothetical protein